MAHFNHSSLPASRAALVADDTGKLWYWDGAKWAPVPMAANPAKSYLSGVDAANMATWNTAKAANAGDVLVIGTSNPYGWGATNPNTDAWPFVLADIMGATRGTEPLNKFSLELNWKRNYITASGTGGSYTRNGDAGVADMGTVDLSGGDGQITYTSADCTGFQAVVRTWGSGFEVDIDGAHHKHVAPPAGPSMVELASGLAKGPHTLRVYNTNGATDLDVRFSAIGGKGALTLHNHGIPGTQSTNWRKDTGTWKAYMQDGTVSKPGGTASNTGQPWASLRNSVGPVDPDLLIIQVGGGNEETAQISPDDYGENLDYIVKWARGQHTGQTPRNPTIIGVIPVGNDPTDIQVRDEARLVYEANDVPIFELEELLPTGTPNAWDHTGHFTTASQALIAKEMARGLGYTVP
jgi:lysophospholipase L1-like esterase